MHDADPRQVIYRTKNIMLYGISTILVSISCLVLVGWWLDQPTVITLFPNFPSMKVNTAIGFLLLGFGIISILYNRENYLHYIIGTLILFLVIVTALEYFYNIEPGIDQFLIKDTHSTTLPGRPSQATLFEFFICSLLILFHRKTFIRHKVITLTLIYLGVSIPIFTLCTYVFQPQQVFSFTPISTMAVHTAIGFLLFFAAISCLHLENNFLALLLKGSTGSRQLRRLLVPLLIAPILIGWMLQQLVSSGTIHAAIAIALFATLVSLISISTLFWNTWREDQWFKRLDAENERHLETKLQLTTVLDAAMGAIFLFDKDGKILSVNRGASRIFGWSYEEMLDKNLDELIPPRLRSLHRQHVLKFQQDRKENVLNNNPIQMVAYNKNEMEIPILVSISKQHIGGQTLFGAVILDAREIADDIQRLLASEQTDHLTKVSNRRSLDLKIKEYGQHGLRREFELAVIMVDVDKYKSINDQYGHAAGDIVLSEFANRARRTLRENDEIFRYGGDEFLIFAHCIDRHDAYGLAERIREEIQSTPFRYEDKEVAVSCSIGICIVGRNECNLEDGIKHADKSLYQAKEMGRNKTVLYSPE